MTSESVFILTCLITLHSFFISLISSHTTFLVALDTKFTNATKWQFIITAFFSVLGIQNCILTSVNITSPHILNFINIQLICYFLYYVTASLVEILFSKDKQWVRSVVLRSCIILFGIAGIIINALSIIE